MHDDNPPAAVVLQTLNQEKEGAEAKVAASATAQGDLRAAVMVKDKVLEDREKVRGVREKRKRESETRHDILLRTAFPQRTDHDSLSFRFVW